MNTLLRIAGVTLAVVVLAQSAWNRMVNRALTSEMAPVNYTQTVETGGPIEAACLARRIGAPWWPITPPSCPPATPGTRWW